MFIPIRTDSPLRRTPYMNWALIIANVLVFLVTTPAAATPGSAGGGLGLLATWHGHIVKQWLSLDPQDPHLWTYFSYQFLHENWMHLIGNMLFLYIFGNNINDRMGNFGYLGFYLAGGVFAGIGHAITSAHPVIGASGAVSAVTGAFLVLLPRSSITIVYFFYLIGSIEIAGLWFVLFFFAKDVLEQFTPLFGGAEAVAHMAHISGTVFGAGVCFALLAGRLLPRDQFDVLALLQRWNRRRQYRDLVAKGYDPFAYTPPTGRSGQPDASTQHVLDLRAEINESMAHRDLATAAAKYLEMRSIDPNQVMSRQAQLDIANQLANQQLYPQAAEAYEQFLHHYPKFDQIEQVQLMLGVIYARYLHRYDRAKECLLRALARLHGDREIQMARAELARIEPLTTRGPAVG